MSRWIGLCGLGAVLCSGGSAALFHLAETRATAAWLVPIALIWGAFALGGARISARLDARELSAGPTLLVIVAVAALIRAPLLGTPPLLSDDVYRYLWEGLAMNAGHNPFAVPPAAIDGLDNALRDRVNHGELTTIYPPLALVWFRLISALGGTVFIAQMAAVVADLAIVGAIAAYGRKVGNGIWPAVLYALHPLPALESACGAHIDTPAIALAALACVAWIHQSARFGIAAAVAGVAVKLLPALLLPALMRRAGWRGVAVVLGATAVAGLLTVPYLSAGEGLFSSFAVYTDTWSFNGFAFPVLVAIVGWPARYLLIVVGLGVGVWTVARNMDPVKTWFWVGSAFVLLSPTVHPWYVLWALVPALLIGSWGWAAAAIPLLGAYAVLGTLDEAGGWSEGLWLWAATWPPALFLLALERLQPPVDSEAPPSHTPRQTGEETEETPDSRSR